jgi:hypothetical protein
MCEEDVTESSGLQGKWGSKLLSSKVGSIQVQDDLPKRGGNKLERQTVEPI